jgi:hypothetical protein
MQITIEVPELLPQVRIRQRIKELEESLFAEAQFFAELKSVGKRTADSEDPWSNPDSELPSVDTGIEDFSLNHDYYLYGSAKQT